MSEAAYLADLAGRVDRAWPTGVPREPFYSHGRVALTDYLRRWAEECPDRTAINFYGRLISYAELYIAVQSLAASLEKVGVTPRDRVAIFMGNCPQFTIAFLAILTCGALVVPINPMVRELELAHYLEDSDCSTIIAQDSLHPILRATEAGRDARVILTALSDFLPRAATLRTPPGLDTPRDIVPETLDFMTLLRMDAAVADFPVAGWDTPAVINYTGGTTGAPKGCLHTHGDIVFSAACTGTFHFGLRPGDVTLTYLGQFWISGELGGVAQPIVCGTTIVLLNRWDAETVMAAIDRYKVTAITLVTDSMVEIMDHPLVGEHDLTSLEWTMVASFIKVLNPDYRARWLALTGVVAKEGGYGMTETNTADTFTTGMQDDNFDLRAEPMFVGLPCPGTELKIVDPDSGALLPLGQPGEICIRTPSLMKGYWKQPEASAAAIRDGWYRTGDSGAIDEAGYLSFRGRKKEMLKVSGMSVFPAEVEALLARHPAVASCGVTGRPDTDKGQVPVAFITLVAASEDTAESIVAWCRANMAGYKVPEIRIADALPMTATGKVKRDALSALL